MQDDPLKGALGTANARQREIEKDWAEKGSQLRSLFDNEVERLTSLARASSRTLADLQLVAKVQTGYIPKETWRWDSDNGGMSTPRLDLFRQKEYRSGYGSSESSIEVYRPSDRGGMTGIHSGRYSAEKGYVATPNEVILEELTQYIMRDKESRDENNAAIAKHESAQLSQFLTKTLIVAAVIIGAVFLFGR